MIIHVICHVVLISRAYSSYVMDGQLDDLRTNSVLLRDDSMGVITESTPRKVQQKGQREFYSSLSPEWLENLNMADQGHPTLHSLSLGVYPVIVQNPAIIIQPAEVINGGKS